MVQNKQTDRRLGRFPFILLFLLVGVLAAAGLSIAVRPAPEAPASEPPALDLSIAVSTPEPTPSSAPALTPEQQRAARAAEILASMSLHEKVCQLFIIYPEQIVDIYPVFTADASVSQALAEWPAGGFLFDKKNMQDRQQVTDLLTGLQRMSEIPLILACDEEGGRVARLMSTVGTTPFGPMLSYEGEGAQTAFDNAETIASDLRSCGFNTDLAPVADVWSNPENSVIGDRAYSTDFTRAADLVAAAVHGFHAGGTACTLKHFPGHGNTLEDSHYGSAYVDRTPEQLRSEELLPFQAGIDAGADAVMVGHLTVPGIDPQPAPFSYTLVTELLREEMGFSGVVMTDSLQMQALSDRHSDGEIALNTIRAGVDMLLCPTDFFAAVQALEDAVTAGELPEERIDESVLRILELKLHRGLLS